MMKEKVLQMTLFDLKPMTKTSMKKWIAALRRGGYKRGRGQLRDAHGGYCCLGVYARTCGVKLPRGGSALLPKEVLPQKTQLHLAAMNDRGVPGRDGPLYSFSEIADCIEATYLPHVGEKKSKKAKKKKK